MKKIKGKIINFDSSFVGTIFFDKYIKKIDYSEDNDFEEIIIPGFIDLHCHG